MPTYVPSDVVTDIQTVAYIRQNPWKKIDDVLESPIVSKKLHIPWTHTRTSMDAMEAGIICREKGARFVKISEDLAVGSLVLIPDGKKGLLARITSDIKYGTFDTICVASKPKDCGHPTVTECDTCRSSIVEAFNPSNVQKLLAHLRDGHIIEPFWSPYRDIDILGEADYNGVDGRSMATANSAGMMSLYWSLVA